MAGYAELKRGVGRGGLWLAVFLACAAQAWAAEGGRPGELFNFGATARALGLGGAYTALAQDASSLYYNPAGLGALPSSQLSLMHAQLFGDATYDYLGYARNFRRGGGWGAHFLREGIGDVPGRDEFNQPTGPQQFTQTGFGLGAGWQGVITPRLSLGLGLKAVDRKLAGSADRLYGADLGAQYGPVLDRRLTVGVVMQNAGSFATGDTDDKLPLQLKVGAACRLFEGFQLAADVDESGQFRIGTEYNLGMFALRGGYPGQGFAVGGGVTLFKSLTVDMAVLHHPALGMSQRMSLGYRFGARQPPKQVAIARDYLADAKREIAAREYPEAARTLANALALNPGLEGEWGEKAGRLKALADALRLESRPEVRAALKKHDEQGTFGAAAVEAYLGGQSAQAMLLAHAALGSKPEEAAYDELLRVLAGLTHSAIQREDILNPKALVKEKLNRSQAYFYSKRFDPALRECQEVLVLDPENVLAWVRLGSIRFALGNTEGARLAYTTALQLDPKDDAVREFMRLQGWQ